MKWLQNINILFCKHIKRKLLNSSTHIQNQGAEKITKEKDMELQNLIGQITKFRLYPLITINSTLSKQYNLSEEHIVALVIIIKQEDPFVVSIANALFISISKTSRIVRDLEKVKLIKRKYGECEDRRKIKLEPTQKGLEVLDSLYKDLMAFFNPLMDDFDKEELTTFTKLIEKFNGIADKKIRSMLRINSPDNDEC